MPGPGPHMLYTIGTGQAISSISTGRFGPHHILFYAINAFFGPDMGSFAKWLASVIGFGEAAADLVEKFIHHPFYYPIILGLPLCVIYGWVSKVLFRRGVLDSLSGVCFYLFILGCTEISIRLIFLVIYAINAFWGPVMGSFTKWLASVIGFGEAVADLVEKFIHHPFYYPIILGFPLCVIYGWVSKVLFRKGLLDSLSGAPLTRKQCLLLITAGSLSHFFLDHLFEENGESSLYTWILSTGWWEGRAPINPDAVIVVGFLCTALICGFIYINRVKSGKSFRKESKKSMMLFLIIAGLYCVWCASQIYLVKPRRPAVGEEADLGVIVFMGIYFFLPHYLCVKSMNLKDYLDSVGQLPP